MMTGLFQVFLVAYLAMGALFAFLVAASLFALGEPCSIGRLFFMALTWPSHVKKMLEHWHE